MRYSTYFRKAIPFRKELESEFDFQTLNIRFRKRQNIGIVNKWNVMKIHVKFDLGKIIISR